MKTRGIKKPAGKSGGGLFPAVVCALLAVSVAFACGGKKEEVAGKNGSGAEEKSPEFRLGSCSVAEIKVEPRRFEADDLYAGSGREVLLKATAYDREGRPVPAAFTWSFRFPDADSEQKTGAGHVLIVRDESRAVFRADGLASGLFTVLVQDRTCNLGTEKEPQYPEGEAWLRVKPPPGAEAVCGRMRVTYGGRLDRMGDEIIASAKALLIAEIYAAHKLGREYKVQFFFNEKPYPGKRPLYRDNTIPPQEGMSMTYVSLLPLYLVPGEHEARYLLLKKGEPVCGSRVERFRAK